MQPPFSNTFHQHYWSQLGAGGESEKTHVFLQGNALPERFATTKAFTVAELGFGTGLTFALTAALWAQKAPSNATLTYISYELEPFTPAAMAALQQTFPAFPQKQAFLAAYTPTPGWNIYPLGQITLHLFIGDAAQGLKTHPAPADAWFLDGFSPDTNPALWSPAIFQTVSHFTAPGGTASTYSVAQGVREGLSAAGFSIEKAPGHPPKQYMLKGVKA